MTCPGCGQETPPGNFCVRCGAPLEAPHEHEGHAPRRGQFAAAPNERFQIPRLVSTLFPQLPRASMASFRIVLAFGVAVVVILAAFRLFPVAFVTAAVLVPLMMVLYVWDVDLYEDEPVWGIGFTLLWGLLAGIAVGLLARAVAPNGANLIHKDSTAHVVTGGVLLPLLGVALMLAGTLVLLPFRRFNDVLDGATFGAVTAAAFVGAEVIVYGVDVLNAGVRPEGDVWSWIWRLLTISVALPVLTMAAVGFATAALWLRFRSPARDRRALGTLGHPIVAPLLAAALVVAAYVAETFTAPWVWLVWVSVLAAIALLLLRIAIHVGLLQEAAEIEIGAPITCANCGATTARHTFCGDCGIALKALPKVRAAKPVPPRTAPSEAGA